jgi:hypothetical protein
MQTERTARSACVRWRRRTSICCRGRAAAEPRRPCPPRAALDRAPLPRAGAFATRPRARLRFSRDRLRTKAGLAPMHTWLPDAHSEAPAPVSALMSGVLLGVGVVRGAPLQANTRLRGGAGFARRILLALGLLPLAVAAVFLWTPRNYNGARVLERRAHRHSVPRHWLRRAARRRRCAAPHRQLRAREVGAVPARRPHPRRVRDGRARGRPRSAERAASRGAASSSRSSPSWACRRSASSRARS